jgi:hypothetical protein
MDNEIFPWWEYFETIEEYNEFRGAYLERPVPAVLDWRSKEERVNNGSS